MQRRTLKLILLKPTTLTAHEYKSVDILPLKSKLEYNKGITMQKNRKRLRTSTQIANF